MATPFEAQIELPAGAYPPEPLNGDLGVQLNLMHVISHDASGRAASYVGDFTWNWTHYHPRKKTANLVFYFWRKSGRRPSEEQSVTSERIALMREMQYLMVRLIYRPTGNMLGFESLQAYLYEFGSMARFAETNSCSLKDVLQTSRLLDSYLTSIPDYRCSRIGILMNFLMSLDPARELGFQLAASTRLKDVFHRAGVVRRNQKQFAPLPTNIYSTMINALSVEIDDIEAHREQLLAALNEAKIEHARALEEKPTERPTIGPEIVIKHGLTDYLSRRGMPLDLSGLTRAITDIFIACKFQIHTFSGMRDEEALHLPYHCMDVVNGNHGKKHRLIIGITTKLAGSRRKRTRWVTTEEGFRAIRLAQQFSSLIYRSIRVAPIDSENSKDNFPLFVSNDYLPWGRKPKLFSNHYSPLTSLTMRTASPHLKQALSPIIEDADVDELEEIDPHRAWRSEAEYQVGKPWSLSAHQLRRSLALYANSSG